MKFWRRELVAATRRAIYGYFIIKRVRLKYGRDTYIFLTRGQAGDIYLYFRFLNNFLEKNHIKKYVFIGDSKNVRAIKKLYPNITGACIEASEYVNLSLQTAYCFFGPDQLKMSLSLMWDADLPYNRCATRLTEKFNYVDSYRWFLFNLDQNNVKPTEPEFSLLDKKLKSNLNKKGVIRGKTVILSPYSENVKNLPDIFWTLLGKELEKLGYHVFVKIEKDIEKKEFGFPGIFFDYINSVPVLEYAGHFIGLRNGFCDIVSSAKCNKVVLYPVVAEEFDGSVHRSDLDFSSLSIMDLGDGTHEITVPFARDICNHEPENENLYSRFIEDKKMAGDILKCFPSITNGDVRNDNKKNKRAYKKQIKKT